MKRKFLLLATTLAIHSAALAQTKVPSLINYQGHITTSAGAVIGSGSSVNRNVTFRFWKSATDTAAASRLYTETQLVTILNGDFSVLIGSGTAVIGEVKPAMATVFANKDVFLGITVDDGNDSTTDVEVTPRQQLVSTAFAFRASVAESAESVASASDLTLTPLTGTATNYGLGWYGTGRLFNSVAVDGPVLYGNSGGALGSSASGSQKLALSWDASGRVGIGATSITSATNKLTLQGDMTTTPGDQFTIRGNTDNNKRLLLGYDTTNNKASLQSYTAASTTGPLLLNPSGGNVGVNNTGPSVALDVTGAIKASTSIAAGTGITAGGNVGIGTTTPGFPLNFAPVSGPKISLFQTNASEACSGISVQPNVIQIHGNATTTDIAFGYGLSSAMTEIMRIKGTGNVGIGTTTPSAPLHVNGSALNSTSLEAYLDQAGAANVSNIVTHPYSIIASSRVRGLAFDVHSDRRIKNSQKLSVGREDLATLMKIEITDYLYKDTVAKGTRPQKKVIAQQVEAVYSQAITQSTEAIPDLYLKGTVKDGWVELATDLKKGERVKLIGDKEESVHEVLEVGDGKFRTDFKPDGEVFVYGREVNDFRSVDYDAISMLNVSATQELKREVDVLRAENARLRLVLEARLSALEQGRSKGATVPVSASQR